MFVCVRVCVCVCVQETQSSPSRCHKTVNPSYNQPFSWEGHSKMKLSCSDSEGYWSQLCNLKWLLCYYFSSTLWPRYSMKQVCVCVSLGMMCLFLNLTAVMQHRLFNMLGQREGHTLVCVCACPVLSLCVKWCVFLKKYAFSCVTIFF